MRGIFFGIICTLFLTSSFAQSTDVALTTQANVIRNENNPGGNTRARIADMFQGLIDSKPSLLSTYPNPSWISSLAWSKLTGTPTTLSGYGITTPIAATLGGTGLSSLGSSLQYLRVNAGATALEYATLAAGIGGSTGSTDNALLRADGTGGATLQSSDVTLSDNAGLLGLGITGVTSGSSRTISAMGSAADILLAISSKGVSPMQLNVSSGIRSVQIGNTTGVTRVLHAGTSDNSNSQVTYIISLDHLAGNGANPGIGVGMELRTWDGSNIQTGTTIESVATDVTGSSQDYDFVVRNMAAGSAAVERFRITSVGGIVLNATNTAGGTTGNQTINKPSGTVNFAAAATSITITNSLVTSSSIVFCTVRTNDATAVIKNVVPGSGSFVITLSSAATAETSVGFFVIN